jgi:preprotein translocase subunit YajC
MSSFFLPLAQANTPAPQQAGPFLALLPYVAILAIFYFIVIVPMRKQKQHEAMIGALKPGDKIIVNPGIYASVVIVEKDVVVVRVDDHTKIKILKSAVTGPQPVPTESTKEKH